MLRPYAACLGLLSLTACASRGTVSVRVAQPDFLESRAPKAQLLMLGVFHFENPGLDTYKPKYTIDVMSPTRQKEIDDLVTRLVRFNPTKVAVEFRKDDQRRTDSLYDAYLAGTWQLGGNEVYQVGFRLAKRLRHKKVYNIDIASHPTLTEAEARSQAPALGMNIDSVIKRDPWLARYQKLNEFQDSLKTVMTLSDYLALINDTAEVRKSHGSYLVGSFKLARETNYVGVDDMTQWYNRNLRIFSNLQQLTDSPAERILVVIGAGHLPILRFLAGTSNEHMLVDVLPYLETRH
jgi:hypothetical protein